MFARGVVILIAGYGLAGCGCTDAGCAGGLFVQTPLDAHRIEVSDGAKDVRSCTKGEPCWDVSDGANIASFAFSPKQAVVRIEDESGDVLAESTEQPKYDVFTPNGEDCPPKCESTSIVID